MAAVEGISTAFFICLEPPVSTQSGITIGSKHQFRMSAAVKI
jgi:hypothetical protein